MADHSFCEDPRKITKIADFLFFGIHNSLPFCYLNLHPDKVFVGFL